MNGKSTWFMVVQVSTMQGTIHGRLRDRPCLMFRGVTTLRFMGLIEVNVGSVAPKDIIHIRKKFACIKRSGLVLDKSCN